MGSFLSKRSEQSSHNKVHQSAVHIINLLSDLNSKCTDTGDDCTLVETRYVDTANLHRSLERYEDTPIFKEYQVAEMIKSLPPVSASLRRNKKKTYSYETTTYFDVYGAEPGGSKHKKINKIISKHVTGNSDIVNIILEYRGNEIFLFTAKTVDSGGGTTCYSSCLCFSKHVFRCMRFLAKFSRFHVTRDAVITGFDHWRCINCTYNRL